MASRKGIVSGGARATIDHDEIRRWVEEHGGQPSRVAGTRSGKNSGILRIDFPGFSGERSLKPISWDEFFERFEAANLAFLYQDKTKSGRSSRFNKLVGRETVEPGSSQKKAPPRRARATRARAGSTAMQGQRRGSGATSMNGRRRSAAASSSDAEPRSTRGRKRVVQAPSAPMARAARTARKTSKKSASPRKASKKSGAARRPSKKTRRSSRQ